MYVYVCATFARLLYHLVPPPHHTLFLFPGLVCTMHEWLKDGLNIHKLRFMVSQSVSHLCITIAIIIQLVSSSLSLSVGSYGALC